MTNWWRTGVGTLPVAALSVAALSVAALSVLTLTGCGAPTPVEEAFAARHPGATAEWEQQPYGWEAVFTEGGTEYEVEFAADGRWLETEREVVEGSGFPPAVLDAIRVEGLFDIGKWEVEETPSGTFYEVEPSWGDGEYYFDATGARAANAHEDA